jgi:hypothetical protein
MEAGGATPQDAATAADVNTTSKCMRMCWGWRDLQDSSSGCMEMEGRR